MAQHLMNPQSASYVLVSFSSLYGFLRDIFSVPESYRFYLVKKRLVGEAVLGEKDSSNNTLPLIERDSTGLELVVKRGGIEEGRIACVDALDTLGILRVYAESNSEKAEDIIDELINSQNPF